MKVTLLIIIAALGLAGCAVNYTYNGQKYDSKEKLEAAVDANVNSVVAAISPLPAPLTSKKLIFAIPSEQAIYAENVHRFVNAQNRQPTSMQTEVMANIGRANFRSTKVFFDALQKKHIYASVQLIEMETMMGSYAASPDTDTLYYTEAAQGAGQWFFSSFKGGKQVFAYDRSSGTTAGKVQGFVDAVQVQAIRD